MGLISTLSRIDDSTYTSILVKQIVEPAHIYQLFALR
jgi:hypothetical protein